MTLVTDASFLKSKVLSGVTYMLRAMEAKLHTATWTEKKCMFRVIFTKAIIKKSVISIGINTTSSSPLPHLCLCTPRSLCTDCWIWWCPDSAGCSSCCRHLCRACMVCQFLSVTRWWRTTAAEPSRHAWPCPPSHIWGHTGFMGQVSCEKANRMLGMDPGYVDVDLTECRAPQTSLPSSPLIQDIHWDTSETSPTRISEE